MGSLVAVILVAAGIVIVVQFIINFVLWKRYTSLQECGRECPTYSLYYCEQLLYEFTTFYYTVLVGHV